MDNNMVSIAYPVWGCSHRSLFTGKLVIDALTRGKFKVSLTILQWKTWRTEQSEMFLFIFEFFIVSLWEVHLVLRSAEIVAKLHVNMFLTVTPIDIPLQKHHWGTRIHLERFSNVKKFELHYKGVEKNWRKHHTGEDFNTWTE